MSLELQEEIRELVMRRTEYVFRLDLASKMSTSVTTVSLRSKPPSCAAKAKTRAYPPIKRQWLVQKMTMLEQAALVCYNP